MASWLQNPLPENFGRYRVLKVIGQGGMGVVYLARDTQLDRQVAIKVPHTDPVRGKKFLDRFEQEARAAARVHHPNICPIYDVGEIDGKRYLTMAFIEGVPLSRLLRKGKRLSPRQAAHCVRKLALALHEAHQGGVVHRDLKPSNVMIDRRGEPIIMDFGLARRFRSEDVHLTRVGTTMGTPTYMAPEQCAGHREAMGPACDIYTLGVILYELLAGSPPFTGDDAMAVLSKVLTEEPQPPSARRADTDPELERICLKAMAKKAADRYPSASALAADLTTYLKNTVGGAAANAPVMPILLDDEPDADEEVVDPYATRAGAPRANTSAGKYVPSRAALDDSREAPVPRKRGVRRVPAWAWIAGGAVVVVLLLALGIGVVVIYHVTDYGTCKLELSEPNAAVTVRVDGTEVDPAAPGGLRLAPGSHEVEVTGKDYDPLKQAFTIQRGNNPPLRLQLPPKLAVVTISLSDPFAKVEIKIDGKAGFRHGQVVRLMPRQQHVVEVTGGGYQNVLQPFTLEPGAVLTMNVELRPLGGPRQN